MRSGAGRARRAGATAPGRRERQKAARERRILRAAEVLFGRRGYAATGMDDVARRAGLAVGTLYNYFPSKPELVLALLRRETGRALEAGSAVLERPAVDPAEAVRALLDVYVDVVARHDRSQLRELFAAAFQSPETVGRAAFEMDLRLLGQLTALLAALRERGALASEVEPGPAATTLYAVYLGWILAYSAAEGLEVERLRAEVARGATLAMRGIAGGGGAGAPAR